jgi:hypothetical protein
MELARLVPLAHLATLRPFTSTVTEQQELELFQFPLEVQFLDQQVQHSTDQLHHLQLQ